MERRKSPQNRAVIYVYRAWNICKHIIKYPKNGWKKTALKIHTEINPKYIVDHEWLTGYDHDYELNYEYRRDTKYRIAVYTSIFGNYDSLKEPLFINENCDYFAITDMEIPDGSVWKKLDITDKFFSSLDNYHKSKYCKLHPHILFPEYDYSIWVDGNVQIVADMCPLIDRMEKSVIATFKNPVHDCIYTESKYLIYYDAVTIEAIEKQINHYRKEGFPCHFGMREFSIIIRKNHDLELNKLMDAWWEEVNTFTMRDQISFPYLLWKNNLTIDYIHLLGGNKRDNPRFIYVPHSWRLKF